ncbi:MAG: hypothetical protein JWM97_2393 [Phycisphaerales bacterium]|nr:hypothetical protein [Phycisphaerales bacterium]
MKGQRRVRLAMLWLAIPLLSGCATYDIPPNRDPCGGALTDSEACLYDYDARGLWYVMFVRCDGLMTTSHRHSPGTHLFITPEGDLLFHSRSSGRGEVLDVMGRTLRLADGTVFLCDANGDRPRVVQLGIPAPRCDPTDAEDVARALYEISRDARVASFLSPESRLRFQADWQAAKKRKRQAKTP